LDRGRPTNGENSKKTSEKFRKKKEKKKKKKKKTMKNLHILALLAVVSLASGKLTTLTRSNTKRGATVEPLTAVLVSNDDVSSNVHESSTIIHNGSLAILIDASRSGFTDNNVPAQVKKFIDDNDLEFRMIFVTHGMNFFRAPLQKKTAGNFGPL
jgi:hypothetical protein